MGSVDETPQYTGIAHLFEHLMFGGSKNVESFDVPVQMSCGDSNAFTTLDYTNYYMVLPKENIEIAMWLESDRMCALNLNQQSLDVQKQVVDEEFKQRYLNKPYGDLWHLLREMCYTRHPYSWPTIGKMDCTFKSVDLDFMQNFYNKYYSPSNAILSVSGDLSHREVLELSQKWFGDIHKPIDEISRAEDDEPITSPRRLEVEREVPVSVIYICFRLGHRMSREFIVCDTISDLLSGGSSSRMVQSLVKGQKLFTSVNAYLSGEINQGLFILTGQLADGVDPKRAEEAIWQEIETLQQQQVSDYELQKIKNKFEVNTAFGELNVMNKAMNLGFYEMLGDIDYINQELECYKSVTKSEIQEVSQTLFNPQHSATLIYKAKK